MGRPEVYPGRFAFHENQWRQPSPVNYHLAQRRVLRRGRARDNRAYRWPRNATNESKVDPKAIANDNSWSIIRTRPSFPGARGFFRHFFSFARPEWKSCERDIFRVLRASARARAELSGPRSARFPLSARYKQLTAISRKLSAAGASISRRSCRWSMIRFPGTRGLWEGGWRVIEDFVRKLGFLFDLWCF